MKTMLLLLFSLCFLSYGWADGFAYHGSLREANGAKFNIDIWNERTPEERTFIFSLYTAATSNAPVWTARFPGDTASLSPDANGNFTVCLDKGYDSANNEISFFTALSMHASATLYLGITVGEGTQELSPRQEILSVPYAAYADFIEGGSTTFTAEANLTIGKSFILSGTLTLTQMETAETDLRGTCDVTGTVTADKLTATGEIDFMGNVSAESVSGYGTIPINGILPFFGETIPEGWALCDGTNGTPDLTHQFILGAKPEDDAHPEFSSGGAETITLVEANLPPHTHTHVRTINRFLYDFVCLHSDSGKNRWRAVQDRSGNSSSGTDANGSALPAIPEPVTILPPFVHMRFIMRVK